jgi:hypothetical protein
MIKAGCRHALPESVMSWWSKSGEVQSQLDHAMISSHFDLFRAKYITQSGQYKFSNSSEAISDHAVLLIEAELNVIL